MKNKNIINIKSRKIAHYVLIGCVIILQILLILLFANESKNEKTLAVIQNKINKAQNELNKTDNTRKELLQTQDSLFKAIYNGENYKNYYSSLNNLNQQIDSLSEYALNKHEQIVTETRSDSAQTSKNLFKDKIDSIAKTKDILYKTKPSPPLSNNIKEEKVSSKNFNIQSSVKVDSVPKRGFFKRLKDAFTGRVAVQKEKVNVVITLKEDNEVSKAKIEEQYKNTLQKTSEYYSNQFRNFKNQLNEIKTNKENIIAQNNKLISYSNTLLNLYDKAIIKTYNNNKKQYQKEYIKNKKTRYNYLIGIIVFMILISILIFILTKFTYQQERQLKESKNKIEENIIFKNRLIGMLSHEIRSPLSIISIYLSLISKKIKDQETTELLQPLQFTAQSLLLLSNQILQYSKNENKKLELTNSTFNLTDESNAILTSLKEMTASNNNKLIIKNNLSKDLEIISDKGKIYQLFYNLIGNANKFTTDGIIEVDLHEEFRTKTISNINIIIKDNGNGIPEADLPYIFDPYFEGNNTNNTSALGSGLGLNLCKEIISLFEGAITIESKADRGTTVKFNLILPLQH